MYTSSPRRDDHDHRPKLRLFRVRFQPGENFLFELGPGNARDVVRVFNGNPFPVLPYLREWFHVTLFENVFVAEEDSHRSFVRENLAFGECQLSEAFETETDG